MDDNARNFLFVPQIDGPEGIFSVEVIQDGTAAEVQVVVAVHRPLCVAFWGLVTDVTFVLCLLVDPRILLVGQVFD